tara:strand:- start:704 stop:1003 length:300 start_codon:yes stop_codon:yes gene_type:complete
MEHITSFEKRIGVDIGFVNGDLLSFDKSTSFQDVLNAAYNTCLLYIGTKRHMRPNIIVKAGKNAKWYIKSCPINEIDTKIKAQSWRDTSRATMWIVKWD